MEIADQFECYWNINFKNKRQKNTRIIRAESTMIGMEILKTAHINTTSRGVTTVKMVNAEIKTTETSMEMITAVDVLFMDTKNSGITCRVVFSTQTDGILM